MCSIIYIMLRRSYAILLLLWDCRIKMFKIIITCVLIGCLFNLVWSMGGNMIENGLWEVKAVNDCENPEQFDFQVSVERRKLNRSHDMFNALMKFKTDLDDNFGVSIKICKWVDGGCKDYSMITDENIVDFLFKMAEDNLKAAMNQIGIEPTFPVALGDYECENYMIDYCEFPCKSVLGLFDAEVILLDRDQKPVCCLIATVEFREAEGDEELCLKCQEE